MKWTCRNHLTFVLLMTATLFLWQCKKENPVTDLDQFPGAVVDSATIKDSIEAAKPKRDTIRYSAFIFPEARKNKDSAMSVFLEKYSDDQRYTILALNRLDNKNRWRADTLAIPEKIETDFLKYSPFPAKVENLKDVKKMAFFSYAIHAYALYENGNLIKWGPSSMGKKATPTKKGLMFTNWKKEVAVSTSNSEWILRWNFNIHNTAGIGWHQYDLPGFHASHSCLRLLEEDAKWMYGWADQWVLTNQGMTVKAKGTPVMVFGDSDFKSKPWLKLIENPLANDITEAEMNDLVAPQLDEILKEQKNSEAVRGPSQLSTDISEQENTEKGTD